MQGKHSNHETAGFKHGDSLMASTVPDVSGESQGTDQSQTLGDGSGERCGMVAGGDSTLKVQGNPNLSMVAGASGWEAVQQDCCLRLRSPMSSQELAVDSCSEVPMQLTSSGSSEEPAVACSRPVQPDCRQQTCSGTSPQPWRPGKGRALSQPGA